MKKNFIDIKLKKLGVGKGTGSSTVYIHAPHTRAASVSYLCVLSHFASAHCLGRYHLLQTLLSSSSNPTSSNRHKIIIHILLQSHPKRYLVIAHLSLQSFSLCHQLPLIQLPSDTAIASRWVLHHLSPYVLIRHSIIIQSL